MGHLALIGLSALLLLALAVLLAPVRLRVIISPGARMIRLSYLALTIQYDLVANIRRIALWRWMIWRGTLAPRKPPPPKKKPPLEKKPAPETARLSARARILWSFRVVVRRTFLVIMRLVGRLLRSLHLEKAIVALGLGLGDPARTGMATGFFHAVQPALRRGLPRWQISLEPYFNRSALTAEADITLRLVPIEPIYHMSRALGTLPWRGLWKLRKAWIP